MEVQEIKTVSDFFAWREDRKNKSVEDVEDVNKKLTDSLGWDYTDVLYSFLGVYAIGVWVYNSERFCVMKKDIKCKERNQKLYSYNFLKSIQGTDEYQIEELNNLECIKRFLKNYSELGNVIPMWPGGNQHKGQTAIFDITEIYFKLHYDWFVALNNIHKNMCFSELIEWNENDAKEEISLRSFLSTVDNHEKYKSYVRKICEDIENRNNYLSEQIKL